MDRSPPFPGVDSEGAPIAETEAEVSAFWDWFAGSVTIDSYGRPMVVYRGEYGELDRVPVLSTRLGSLSFGDRETALSYAHHPNRAGDALPCPRVHAAYLAIRTPIVNQPDDPFIELTTLGTVLGRDNAVRIATKFAMWVMQTSPWANGEIRARSVEEFLDADPRGLERLYVQAFPLFDDPEEVARLKDAGFDGAIYGGAGANAGEIGYRLFDATAAGRVRSVGNVA